MIALLLDTETTGLIENRSMALDRLPEVIEFYGLITDLRGTKSKRRRELHRMIRPQRPLQEETVRTASGRKKRGITEITGITNEMLSRSPPFSDVADEVFSFIEGAPLVIAQNASFDVDMLDIEADRLGRKIAWPPVLCSIEQSVHYKGYRLNLGDLHEHLLGEKFAGAHRAKADVEALARCCVEMHRRGDL